MITVNVRGLMESIQEANCFSLPEMNAGTEYLYNNVYRKLSAGDEVALSSLDFDSFEADDIHSFNNLYSEVFERNEDMAGSLISSLRGIAPTTKMVNYI